MKTRSNIIGVTNENQTNGAYTSEKMAAKDSEFSEVIKLSTLKAVNEFKVEKYISIKLFTKMINYFDDEEQIIK